MVNYIDGMYSFVLYDSHQDVYFAARDHVGITTLYQGWNSTEKTVWFASELKVLFFFYSFSLLPNYHLAIH